MKKMGRGKEEILKGNVRAFIHLKVCTKVYVSATLHTYDLDSFDFIIFMGCISLYLTLIGL